ncbi:hypothetical protein D9V41_06980 [Aeromicrobium phragmitis]|uniref:ESX secretion-associated protein EspG n=1 Tax=Aeromicrobium phragmitis TaxID=2478914 RepID=A0A3L8PLD4_9ACTN|nr:hypothetical protein [Aeromicrobium phragmitis]RLV56177.1 hypothetical protein D9V41_06980 [Aeromicrobium phragmitis]
MNSTALAISGNAARVRLAEDDWAAVVRAARLDPTALGALAPLTEPSDRPLDEATVAAAGRTCTSAPVTVTVSTSSQGRGLHGSLASDTESLVAVTRVVAASEDPNAPAALVPGVELSVARASQLVEELSRLVPPLTPTMTCADAGPWSLPHDSALSWAAAVAKQDDAVLDLIARQCGWSEPPDVLVNLAEGLDASVTVQIASLDHPRDLLRWLGCGYGWVGLSVTSTHLIHALHSRRELLAVLVERTALAFDRATTARQEGGGR